MPPPLSETCKNRIEFYIKQNWFTRTIINLEEVDNFVVNKLRRNLKKYDQHTASQKRKSKRLIDSFMIQEFHDYLLHKSWAYQNEMILYLYDDWSIVCDEETISKVLKHYEISKKKIQRETLKRSQTCRDSYMLQLFEFTNDQLCFLDEIVVNEHTLHRKRAWVVVEATSRIIRLVKKSKKFSFLLVYTKDEIMTYHIVQKNYIQILFEWFLKQKILSQCNVFSEFRFVLIMNNASIHYHRDVKLLCVKTNVKLIYLSFYSFDFNSIEEFFSILKIWLKRHYEDVNVIENDIKNVLYLAIDVCNNERTIKKHFEHVDIKIN